MRVIRDPSVHHWLIAFARRECLRINGLTGQSRAFISSLPDALPLLFQFTLLYLIAVCVLVATKPASTPGHGPLQFMKAGADLWRLYLELKDETLALEIPSSV
jgi:hypothetical protein